MGNSNLIELDDTQELQKALSESYSSPVVILKHSLTCPISANAYRQMDKLLAGNPPEGVAYRMIVVQHARSVSDAVARELGIEHESPQVIIVQNGKAVWNASHYDITEDSIRQAVQSL